MKSIATGLRATRTISFSPRYRHIDVSNKTVIGKSRVLGIKGDRNQVLRTAVDALNARKLGNFRMTIGRTPYYVYIDFLIAI